MKIVDANVLVYATDRDAIHHDPAWRWLNEALSGNEALGLSWLVITAFIRLSTHPAVFPHPLTPDHALDTVAEWLSRWHVVALRPTPAHLATLRSLLSPIGTGGNLVNDAHLAALAVEHRATIVSYDNDFSRFPGVRWQTPDELLDR